MRAFLVSLLVPLLDLSSITAFVLGIKLLVRIRASRRGLSLIVGGVVLAIVGTLFEFGRMPPLPAVMGATAGGLVGVAVAGRLAGATGPLLRLWGVALGAVATAAVACGVVGQGSGVTAIVATIAAVTAVASALLVWRAALRPTVLAGAASVVVAGVAIGLLGFAVTSPPLILIGALLSGTAMALRRIGRAAARPATDWYRTVRVCDAEEAAMVLEAARKVMIVPGYGMALAQAHHALKDVAERLGARADDVDVRWAIHPAAGRIPGHMNVLLDEANVPQAHLLEVAAANASLRAGDIDVALVVGADDIVNPDALRDDDGPLYGLEIVESHLARAVLVIKRTLDPSEAGVRNPLFEKPNTTLVFGDGKRVVSAIGAELKSALRAVA